MAKILGVKISADLKWNVHVSEMLKKAKMVDYLSVLTCLMVILIILSQSFLGLSDL